MAKKSETELLSEIEERRAVLLMDEARARSEPVAELERIDRALRRWIKRNADLSDGGAGVLDGVLSARVGLAVHVRHLAEFVVSSARNPGPSAGS